jgi:hypothetical protein
VTARWGARTLLVSIAMASLVVPLPASAESSACKKDSRGVCSGSGTDDFTVGITDTHGPQTAPVSASGPRGPKQPLSPTYVDRSFVPTCTGNSAYDAGVLCGAAVYTCSTEGDIRFWVFETTIRRSTGKPEPGTGPRLVDTVCLGPDEPAIDPAVAIPAMVQQEFKSVVVLSGAAQVSPKPETLVNIDTRFRTDAPASYAIPLTLLNRQVIITATAQRYIWQLGNGESRVSTRPDGYLEHTYRTAGAREVRVDIEWSGTFSIDGGPAQPITGTVVTEGEPTVVRVQQARTELVRD